MMEHDGLDMDIEHFVGLALDVNRQPKGYYHIGSGTINEVLVSAHEVFRPLIVMRASGVILAHNHPSGDPTPTRADVSVTRGLIEAGHLLKIDVLDHIVIGAPSERWPAGCASVMSRIK